MFLLRWWNTISERALVNAIQPAHKDYETSRRDHFI